MTFQDVIRISLELSKTYITEVTSPLEHLKAFRDYLGSQPWTIFTFSPQAPVPGKQRKKQNNRFDLDKVVLHSCPR